MTTTDQILRRAEELHAAKMAALQPLAELVALRDELRRKLAETDDAYGRAYVSAEAAGWSAVELDGIGAETPQKRPKGRPRKPRAPRVQGASEVAAKVEKASPAVPEQASSPAGAELSPA
jgi:hypothetical protein